MKQKTKYPNRKYKMASGLQQISLDSPDYSELYNSQEEAAFKNKSLSNAAGMFSGAYGAAGQVGGVAADVIRNRSKDKKKGAIAGGAVEMGASGAALGMQLGGPWGALAGGVIGGVYGGIKGKKDYEEQQILGKEADEKAYNQNYAKRFSGQTVTDAQSFLSPHRNTAKNGKYKVKTKEPRLIETEGREPIFSPKKSDGTRDLLYYNPNDPTHEEGGVKAVVVPRNKYNNGVSNLMPKRSKESLLGSGKMAYGAKQVKVNDLNNTALSQNLSGMPSANAANKFIQPTVGLNQVARQIKEDRRKEKGGIPTSHRTENKDINREIRPPRRYEEIPKDTSSYNNKNNFKKGGKYIKVYKDGSKSVSLAFSRGEKDPKGGLTQKGVDKYNRATGGNLKMAVTTPPSKLKPGSKAANRRKSFCARMSGVKGPMEKNGKPTRKALALRKWNC